VDFLHALEDWRVRVQVLLRGTDFAKWIRLGTDSFELWYPGIGHITPCRIHDHREYQHPCDAGVTQILSSLPKLTSLTAVALFDSITCVAATWPGQFGLQVRLPQPFHVSGVNASD
jgi:hypothetical protein